MRLSAAVLVLAVAGPAWAGGLTIAGETKVPAYRLVELTAAGADPAAALIWDVSDEDAVDAREVGGRLLFAAPPGVYRVKLRSILFAAGKVSVDTARATVTVGDPPAPPPPGPAPGPGPGPKPPGPAPDPAMVAAFRAAVATDVAAGATKAHAAALAGVYAEAAATLGLGDPAVSPKTIGELYSKTFAISVRAGLPRRPYLSAVRGVIDAATPDLSDARPLDPALSAELRAKYLAIAAALTEASK